MPLPPDLTDGPFTTADLMSRGLRHGVLDGPSVRRVLRGVHLAREVDLDLALRWRPCGVVLARHAAALVRERVDSARESELRLCLLLAGLPELEADVVVGRAAPPGRFDLVHRLLRGAVEYEVAVEHEGDQHRTDPTQWNRDIDRHEALQVERPGGCGGLAAGPGHG